MLVVPLNSTTSRSMRLQPAIGQPGEPLCRTVSCRGQFDPIGKRLGEDLRGGGFKLAAEQAAGAGGVEAQRPPELTIRVDFGELHRAAVLIVPHPDRFPDPAGWQGQTG